MGVEGLDDEFRRLRGEADRQFGIIMRAQKKEVGLFAMQQADQLTPVDTGEARKGWHFDTTITKEARQSEDQLQQLAKVVDESDPGADLYLQNFVPQIDILDQGLFVPPDPGPSKDPRPGRKGRVLVQGGYSVQAPTGIRGDLTEAVAAKFGLRRTEGS